MAGKKRFALNVMMNWVAVAVGMVIPFFLTPFVIRHLGVDAYGVWILAMSTVSYIGLLDLGLRSAIIRFVSKANAEGDMPQARSAINAALWFRVLISAGVGVISIALAALFPHLFKIPTGLEHASQVTVLLCALGVAITLISGVFGGVLSAINRFDVLSSITVGQTVARAIGVLVILRLGGGLVQLAIWEFVVITLAGFTTLGAALRLFPACRSRLHKPQIETLRKIWSYSFYTFMIVIAVQIVFYSDNLVVGAFLSVGAAAIYSIGGSLANYSGQASTAMGQTFIPLASGMDASGRADDLKTLLIRGTQAALALALPIDVALVLRGKTFINLWMGHQGIQFGETSGTVLQILMISQFFTVANSTAGQIAYGVEKHKSVAKFALMEAVLNLALSIILVKTIGIYGVAWGTSISMGLLHLIFWPANVRKMLGISPLTYIWQGWIKISLASIPFAIFCEFTDKYWHASSMLTFFGQIFAILPVYLISVLVVFREEVASIFRRWKASKAVAANT